MKIHNDNNLPTIPITDLLPTQGDLKDLTEKNYKKLKNTIEKRGFSVPVYVWEDGKGIKHLLDGHQRRRVLETEGWNDPIPYLKVPAKDLQEAMARLLEITSQYGTITQEGIDSFIAKYELPEADVYEATSFDGLSRYGEDKETEVEEDEAPEVDTGGVALSVLGTVYQLGRHRVMCGSSTDLNSVDQLTDSQLVDMVFTDPPYNVDYGGGVETGNKQGYKPRKIENDKMSDEDWNQFVRDYMASILTYCKGNIYIAMSDKELGHMQRTFTELGGRWASFIIWVKNSLVLSAKDYHSRHETILYGWHKDAENRQRVEDRKQDDVWEIDRPSRSEEHPTMKPVELCARAIRNSSKRDASVLDLFLGSGSTLIACEQTDRTCYGMELDPKYTDVIRRRYWKFVNNGDETGWEENTPMITESLQ